MPGRTFRYDIRVDEDGNLVSSIDDLAGVRSVARSPEELRRRTEEAIAGHFDPEPRTPPRAGPVRPASGFD
jgi:predicted RNase H-like HicB family nuclease